MSLAGISTSLMPELILLAGACGCLLLGLARSRTIAGSASAFCLLVILMALATAVMIPFPGAGPVVPGLWLNSLTQYTRFIALGIGALIVLINWHQSAIGERGEYLAMILFSLLGLLLTSAANDWVVLFFAVELVSVPTYVLVGLSREDVRASESAVKYFFLGSLSAALLAFGISFLYGASGTTTMHSFAEGVARSTLPISQPISGPAFAGLMLVLAGLAFKVAAFPLHAYAPDVYEGAASPITGLLGFVPKAAGFVALIQVAAFFRWDFPPSVWWTLWAVAAATMTTGNVLALLQKNVKRMLAYSSIAHSGYMLVAFLVGPGGGGPLRNGIAALLFYLAVYGAMNLGAFALLSIFQSESREVETLEDFQGLAASSPLASLAFAVCVFSLMGFPPTAGFLGKFFIIGGAFSTPASHPYHGGLLALAVLAVINTAVGAGYYLRIVGATYARGVEGAPAFSARGGAPLRWGLGLCASIMLLLFFWPAGLLGSARTATASLQGIVKPDAGRLTDAAPVPAAGGARELPTVVANRSEKTE